MDENNAPDKFTIFHIDGGVGKNILATAVIRSYKNQHPDRKIVVTTSWPEAWFNNPDVFRFYPHGNNAWFHDLYVKGKDVHIVRHEPYFDHDYILRRRHLVEVWCKLAGIPYDGSNPAVYVNPLEIELMKLKVNKTRPILLMQTSGGGEGQRYPFSWYRDLPLGYAQKVADHFRDTHDIVHLGRKDQPLVQGATRPELGLREAMVLFAFSDKRLLIDSFGQHLCAAFQLPSTVVWIGNDPGVLGYAIHKNIRAQGTPVYNTYHSSYLEDFSIGGEPLQYPYNTLELFDINELIRSLEG